MTGRRKQRDTVEGGADRLRKLGPTLSTLPWRDYVRDLGLQRADMKALLEIVLAKPGREPEWAAVHARRALAELGAIEILEPVIALAREDDGAWLELPVVAGMIGPAALPVLGKMLATLDRVDADLADPIVHAILLIATWHPSARQAAGRLLCDQLQAFAMQNRVLNGLLAAAVEAIPDSACAETIETLKRQPAYAADSSVRLFPLTREGVMETASAG